MTEDQTLFEQALAAARNKDFATARSLLMELLKQNPKHLDGWLLAAHVVDRRSDAIHCWQRVLELDPNHAYARRKLAELQGRPPAAAAASPPAPAEKPAAQEAAPQPASPPVPVAPQAVPPTAGAARTSKSPAAKPNKGKWLLGLAAGLIVVLCLVALGMGLSQGDGLFASSAQPTPNDQELFNVIYLNAQAANNENIPAYMATIHSKSPMYRQTEKMLQDVFSQYDLSFWFYDLQVTNLTSKEARVHFSLSTTRIRGPSFRDNIVTGTMILRPEDGIWKIYNQEVENTQYQ